jgi:CheY-like chemotaxis protein
VRIENICDRNVSDVRGDAGRLQQVVYNLLTNAVKFTSRGGKVQVTCQRVNSHIEISVSDTGAGIKAEFLPYVFERFRQQDGTIARQHAGLGLGLSIVKQIVEMHGGKVQAASAGEGKGATFTIHLPVAIAIKPQLPSGALEREHPAAPGATGEPLAEIDTSRLRGRKILIVEDERDARALLCKVLEPRGVECHEAASGEEALRLLRTGLRPDLIVSDLGMPGINGYDLMTAIRRLSPSQGGATPALALTAFARAEDRTRSLLAGYQLHLSKPVEQREFLASVVRLLA